MYRRTFGLGVTIHRGLFRRGVYIIGPALILCSVATCSNRQRQRVTSPWAEQHARVDGAKKETKNCKNLSDASSRSRDLWVSEFCKLVWAHRSFQLSYIAWRCRL